MKLTIVFFAVLIGGMIFIHQSLQNGNVLKFIDTHPSESYIPKAAYSIGQGYYLFQDLPEAATYFIRVAERYPKNPVADDALFAYIQCLDDSLAVNRETLVEKYKDYLEKYPNGNHVDLAKNRVGIYSTGSR